MSVYRTQNNPYGNFYFPERQLGKIEEDLRVQRQDPGLTLEAWGEYLLDQDEEVFAEAADVTVVHWGDRVCLYTDHWSEEAREAVVDEVRQHFLVGGNFVVGQTAFNEL